MGVTVSWALIVAVAELYDVLYPGAVTPPSHSARHSPWLGSDTSVRLCFRSIVPVMPTEFRGHGGPLMVPHHVGAGFRPFALTS